MPDPAFDDVRRACRMWIDGPSELANAMARNQRVLLNHIETLEDRIVRMTEDQLTALLERRRAAVPKPLLTLKRPRTAPKQAREGSEDATQKALMDWAQYVSVGSWRLSELLTHVPNGGNRSAYEAAMFKLMGVQSGYPDLLLDFPAGRYHGARWELKYGKNKPTEKQIGWHEKLRALGYYVNTCWRWEEAAEDIKRYLAQSEHTVIERVQL